MLNLIMGIAIGWLFFFLLARQVNPFSKPKELLKRPRWIFSLGIGLLTTNIFMMKLVGDANTDLISRIVIKGAFFLIGFIAMTVIYFIYRSIIKQSLKTQTPSSED